MRRVLLVVAAVAAVTAITGVLRYTDASPTVVFILAGLALAGLAWLVGLATESVDSRFGPAVTGVLQSTLGNLPELFIVLFALPTGEIVVAQTSILGSLLANALLVLGLAFPAGRRREDGIMRFRRRQPSITATLLCSRSPRSLLLGLSDRSATARVSTRSRLRGRRGLPARRLRDLAPVVPPPRRAASRRSRQPRRATSRSRRPIVLLAAAGVAAAFVSDWFVHALDPAVEALGISKAFTGIVIVGIAGNAVENVVGITLAAKGQWDLAVSVVKNSVAQIALLSLPGPRPASRCFFTDRLTFVLNPGLRGRAGGDGGRRSGRSPATARRTPTRAFALVGMYVILATVTFFK